MRQFANPRSKPLALRLALVVVALSALLVPALAGAAKTATVKLAVSAAYDKPILVNFKGRTLYTLSSEKTKFVCVGTCLDAWPPLVIPAGVRPEGPVPLSTKKRPDGRMQITYKGFPLYTFSGDKKRGDANGEGIRGGGVWHAAEAPQFKSGPAEPTPPPASTTPPPPSNPNPYGY